MHSPDWHAFFDPGYFSHSPDQFYMGGALAGFLLVAGIVVLLACLRLRRPAGSPDRRSSPEICLVGLLLGAAILFVFFLALGTHGPLDALPLRAVRKIVPPFRIPSA